MKKSLVMIIASAALASFAALAGCASDDAAQAPAEDAAAPAASESAAPAEEEAPESKYAASIDALEPAADYEGKAAVVVTYSWTNNSDEAISAAAALSLKAFQNGVQLESGIVTSGIDSDGYMAEVKPGAGTTFQMAYLTEDQSDVTVEVSELISFSDALLAEQVFTLA
ncbi:MAG: DUF5067 domain-containing protein [Slackia sp.]|nr:DUF5067 domain-containing protein [Slackia sp.]